MKSYSPLPRISSIYGYVPYITFISSSNKSDLFMTEGSWNDEIKVIYPTSN